jgi:hypothetical protein
MPTEKRIISFIVTIHYNKKVDVNKLLSKETEWIGDPKSSNGCITKMKYFNSYNINILKKKELKHEPSIRTKKRTSSSHHHI